MARFGRDMMIYAGADLLGSSIGLVLSPVFSRLLTPAQYGAQAALNAIWAFVAIAQYAGMDSAYPNFRSRTTDEELRRRQMVTASGVAFASTLFISGTFGLIGLATTWVTGFAEVTRWELFAYVLTLAPGGMMAWLLILLRFERRAAAFARISLIGRVLGSLVLIPVLLMVEPSKRLFAGFLITAGVTLLATGLGLRELARQGIFPLSRESFRWPCAKEMLRFGLVLIPISALYATSTVLDRLLVTWFAGSEQTGILALALRLGAVATMLRTWFALVWDPQVMEWIPTLSRAELLAKLQLAQDLIRRVGAILVVLAALWTEPLVKLLYPVGYWEAVRIVPWGVLGVAVSAFSLVAVTTVTIAQNARLYVPVYVVGLFANLAVGFWCVPKLGAIGAVAGVIAGEAAILATWIVIGTFVLKNLPLRWVGPWLTIGGTGLFIAFYRPGVLLEGWIGLERVLLSVAVLLLLGVPVVRRLWEWRGQVHA